VIDPKHFKTALQVQDACNLSGVVKSFDEALTAIWVEARSTGKGTDWVNTHPICVMFSDKIRALTKSGYNEVFRKAYDACWDGAKAKPEPEAS